MLHVLLGAAAMAATAPECACPGGGTTLRGDPHLSLAHGGRADFRGRNATLYNFLSDAHLSVNAKIEHADFRLHGNLIHGSFVTAVHAVVRTSADRFLNLTHESSVVNRAGWSYLHTTGSCASGGRRVFFRLGPHQTKVCDDVTVGVDVSSARLVTPEWTVVYSNRPVYGWLAGPKRRVACMKLLRRASSSGVHAASAVSPTP